MATYYWLGVTGASGNINNPANWTLWAPGATTYLPPAAPTGPAFNDSIVFTRYNVTNSFYGVEQYPLVAPQGMMYGRTGAGAPQSFNVVTVKDDCPVVLGTKENHFKFNAKNVYLNVGPNNDKITNTSNNFIELGKHSSVGQYAWVRIDAAKPVNYYLSGEVWVASANTQTRNTYASIHCDNLIANTIQLDDTLSTPNGIFSHDQVTLYDTTTITSIATCSGQYSYFFIKQGFQSSGTLYQTKGTVEFVSLPYGSGSPKDTRTSISLVNLHGANKTACNMIINHGIDISDLWAVGGSIYFYQSQAYDSSVVNKGYLTDYAKIHAKQNSVTLGVNPVGGFVWMPDDKTTGEKKPDINIEGYWNFYIIPNSDYNLPPQVNL